MKKRKFEKENSNFYLMSSVLQDNLQLLQGLNDDPHGLNGVAEDDLLERLTVLLGVPSVVNQLHLLQNGALAGLTST